MLSCFLLTSEGNTEYHIWYIQNTMYSVYRIPCTVYTEYHVRYTEYHVRYIQNTIYGIYRIPYTVYTINVAIIIKWEYLTLIVCTLIMFDICTFLLGWSRLTLNTLPGLSCITLTQVAWGFKITTHANTLLSNLDNQSLLTFTFCE